MTTQLPPAAGIVRYSDRPLSAYVGKIGTVEYGPATSSLLDTAQAWNLAFLSFDFDAHLHHPDPQFTTLVRRTLQTKLDGSGCDLIIGSPFQGAVGSWLALPAPRFSYLVKQHRVLVDLPLYQTYGHQWLKTIEERSRICNAEAIPQNDDVSDLTAARQFLSQIFE